MILRSWKQKIYKFQQNQSIEIFNRAGNSKNQFTGITKSINWIQFKQPNSPAIDWY